MYDRFYSILSGRREVWRGSGEKVNYIPETKPVRNLGCTIQDNGEGLGSVSCTLIQGMILLR